MKLASLNTLGVLLVVACLLDVPWNSRGGGSLLVYDFELQLGPVGNVDHVRSLGFDGIVTSVAAQADLPKLQAYADHVATLGGFELLAFVVHDFARPASLRLWRDSLPILASAAAPLWVIVMNAPSATEVRDLLWDMAEGSRLLGIPTVLYPHWETSIETAAQAATLIAEVAHPNLWNSLHTCHEIRGGNQYDLPAVVAAHAGQSALVAIAGARDGAHAGPPPPGGIPWDDAILPLDRGGFDLLPFLQALEDADYDGRVILQTFGITGDPGHRQRSLHRYRKYRSELR